jgi:hypothetical protein
MTETVLPFESSNEEYVADACVFLCFDDRMWRLRKELIKKRGFKNVDLVLVAGSIKALAGDNPAARDFLLDQIDVSRRLHHTKEVILTLHIDCGAYGFSKSFPNLDAEYRHHEAELTKAKAVVNERFPNLKVSCFIADFDGLHKGR